MACSKDERKCHMELQLPLVYITHESPDQLMTKKDLVKENHLHNLYKSSVNETMNTTRFPTSKEATVE